MDLIGMEIKITDSYFSVDFDGFPLLVINYVDSI